MIRPSAEIAATDVADHYNELDEFYRELWGDHLHHGLWLTGRESADEAVEQLVSHIADRVRIRSGDRICDVGCGYGATARYLAHTCGALVTGVTISQAQLDYAVSRNEQTDNPRFLLRNWEQNDLAPDSFNGLVSIECLSHIENKSLFFREVRRVLRPGCRAVTAVWLASEEASAWHVRRLLEPICREGRLPGLGTKSDYVELLEREGLRLVGFEDLSQQVSKTWRICGLRALAHLVRHRHGWRFLKQRSNSNRVFFLTLWRIIAAYRLGVMRYGLFVMERP